MTHEDHVALLRPGISEPGGVWADLGSGSGAFTLALADLLGPQAYIYSVDRDRGALHEQQRAMQAAFPAARVEYIAADFTQPLNLPPLEGIVMAVQTTGRRRVAIADAVHPLYRRVVDTYAAGMGIDVVAVPAGARIIDLTGKSVIPGLVMVHEHLFYPTGPGVYANLAESFTRLYLAGGVTTIVDLRGDHERQEDPPHDVPVEVLHVPFMEADESEWEEIEGRIEAAVEAAPDVTAAFGSLKDFPHPSFYFRRIEQLRQVMVDSGDAAKQVWLTEWGWTSDSVHPNYAWFAVSEQKKADNLVSAFQYAHDNWTSWIGVMMVWTLPDPTWDQSREEYWWAIANPDGTPRTAYNLIKTDRLNGVLP